MAIRAPAVRYAVHPSVTMAQAIVRNLEPKTGRSLDGWLALLRQAAPRDKKERLRWLKAEHGLGGTAAGIIVDAAEEGAAERLDSEAYLAAAPRYVDAMYAGAKAALRPIHDALVQEALALGADVKVSPATTIVPLYRRHVFAQIKPATNKRLDLGLALKNAAGRKPARLVDTGGQAKGDRITHRIGLAEPADIDAEVLRWLRTAYGLDAG